MHVGFILKPFRVTELFAAIESAQAGRSVIVQQSVENAALKTLTESEMRLLESIARGDLNKEIAARLDVKLTTVAQRVVQIYHKLGVRTRVEAANVYFAHSVGPPISESVVRD